jgi:hypothetical protein
MFSTKEISDALGAVQAAESTSKTWHKDVYIMPDLSIMLAEEATGKPIEIIRYRPDNCFGQ